MITEDYVSFEIAKLLKEKKALIDYTMGYDENGDLCNAMKCGVIDGKRVCILNGNDKLLMAPTQSVVMRWLREEKNIAITIAFDWDWIKDPMDVTNDKDEQLSEFAGWFYEIDIIKPHQHLKESNNYATYEEACEAAFKYCLENLI